MPESDIGTSEQLISRDNISPSIDQAVFGISEDRVVANEDARSEERTAASAQVDMVSQMLKQVNAHLAKTLADLERARCDLRNLIEIADLAAVFVDHNLNIKRFTPSLTTIFDVGLADIGASLSSVATKLPYPELSADFDRVRRGEHLIEKHLVGDDGGSRYLMRMRAYHSNDGSTDGVAIVFSNVSDQLTTAT